MTDYFLGDPGLGFFLEMPCGGSARVDLSRAGKKSTAVEIAYMNADRTGGGNSRQVLRSRKPSAVFKAVGRHLAEFET